MFQMKKQVQAYFVEARWLHENYMPTMDEYMRISLISSGYPLLTCISFVGMGDIVTKDAFEWLNKDPKIVKAASVIARLMDDIVSHKVCVLCFLSNLLDRPPTNFY
jgi:hypothetical protein